MSQRSARPVRSAEAAVDRLEKLYADASAALVAALDRYLSAHEPPTPATRATFRYPLLRVVHRNADGSAEPSARLRPAAAPGVYETTITTRARFAATCWSSPPSWPIRRQDRVAVSEGEIPHPCWSAPMRWPAGR
jgi:AMP nucleosidase